MNFLQLKNQVALELGNMKSGHPHYASLGDWVNQGLWDIPEMLIKANNDNINLFPEFNNGSWSAQTTIGSDRLAFPVNCLMPTAMFYFSTNVTPLNTSRGQIVTYLPIAEFELLDKSTPGLPSYWSLRGREMRIVPVPDATYQTYVRIVGVSRETKLTGDTQVPIIEEQWHQTTKDRACYIGAKALNWPERMALYRDAINEKLAGVIDPTALLLSHREGGLVPENAPSRWSVYDE